MSEGNLRFEVEVDVSKFKQDVKQIEDEIKRISEKYENIPPMKSPVNPAVLGSFDQLSAKATELRTKMNAINPDSAEWKAYNKELGETQQKLDGIGGSAGKAGLGIKGMVGGLFAAIGIKELGSQIIQVTSEFQKYEAVLTNSLGSEEAAAKAMGDIKEFASTTPFQLNELTDSYIKLVGRGIQPSIEEMTKMGDFASSSGKSMDQLTEAILDGANPERWKEFGVSAKVNGDMATLSFRGMSVEVENSAAGAKKAVEEFNKIPGVAGTMAAVSETMGGQISNLQDKISNMFNEMGNGSDGFISGAIGGASLLVDNYEEVLGVLGILVSTYGAYKAVVMLTAAAQKANVAAEQIKNFFTLTKTIQGATAAQQGLNAAQKANVIGIAIASITALVGVIMLLREKTKTAADAQADFNSLTAAYSGTKADADIIARYEALDKLKQTQGLNNEQQAEYNKLMDQLAEKMPGAIAQRDQYGNAIALNTEKLKGYNEADMLANSRVAKKQLEEDMKALAKLEEKQKKQQEIFMGADTKEVTVGGGGMYGGVPQTITVDMADAKDKAAKKYQELKQDVDKFKESIKGTANLLGKDLDEATRKRIIELEVNVNPEVIAPDAAKAKEEVAKTVGQQIAEINNAIKEEQKKLVSMRDKTKSTATDKEIEATEKGIKDLEGKLSTLTGVAVKKQAETVKGTLNILENELKKLKEKEGSFFDKDQEAKNGDAIIAKAKEIESYKLKIQMAQKDTTIVSSITGKSVGSVITTSDSAMEKNAMEQAGITNLSKATDIQKARYNDLLKAAKEVTNEHKLMVVPVKQVTNELQKQANKEAESAASYDISLEKIGEIGEGLGIAANVTGSLSNLAGAFDDNLGDAVGTMADITGQAADLAINLASENWIGVVTSGLTLVTSIINAEKEAQAERIQNELTLIDLTMERIDIMERNGLITSEDAEAKRIAAQREKAETVRIKAGNNEAFAIGQSGSTAYRSITANEVFTVLYGPNWTIENMLEAIENGEEWIADEYNKKTGSSGTRIAFMDSSFEKFNADAIEAGAVLADLKTKVEDTSFFSESDIANKIYDGISQGLQLGENDLGGFADGFNELLKQAAEGAILDSFSNETLLKIQEWFKAATSEDSAGGKIITEEEYKAGADIYRKGVENQQAMAKAYELITGDLLKTDVNADNTLKGAIKGITEQTAGALEGKMNSIQLNVIDMRGLMVNQLESLRTIAGNTSYNWHLQSMAEEMTGMKNALIKANTSLSKIAGGTNEPFNI